MVIAFVVLGLILGFTRTIFKFGSEKTTGIFEATDLETKPDADNTLTIPDTVSIKAKGTKTYKVGYYNKNSFTATTARFAIASCQNETGGLVDQSVLPTITSAAQNVEASDSAGYNIIVAENGLASGKLYICTVVVHGQDSGTPTDLSTRAQGGVYETKQIFFSVTA
jgi:hypothetical protein